jgi:hypothetical protein
MLTIKAHYTIPSLRHTFMVIPSLPMENKTPYLLLQNSKRKSYFERAVLAKDCMYNEQNVHFTNKVIAEDDFLESLAEMSSMCFSKNMLFDSPEELDLLSINLVKGKECPTNPSFASKKLLCRVLEEDIIEVFI